jgi:hypothetical protein
MLNAERAEQANLLPPVGAKTTPKEGWRISLPNIFKRGRRNPDQQFSTAHPIEEGINPDLALDGAQKEAVLDDSHKVTDIYYNLDPRRASPMRRGDIEQTMEWADHPTVGGHIYQLESTPRRQDLSRWYNFLLYYEGLINDQGAETNRRSSTFFKAVNGAGENERMLANCRLWWDEVPFLHQDKNGKPKDPPVKVAYWERLIVDPKFQGKKVGLAFGIEVLDTALLRSDRYEGLPADEVECSIYVDKPASGFEEGHVGFDRNALFLRLLGFREHGPVKTINGRDLQPMRINLARYRRSRPEALKHLEKYQPERMEYLGKIFPELEESLRLRIVSHFETQSASGNSA